MVISLAGQTAFVTGGNKGIGRATCFALEKEGANIVIAARNESEPKEALDQLKDTGSKAFAVSC